MSGIYISGISMPTGCETCYFHRWVDIGVGTCAGCELLKELMNDDRDRLPNCPLIPVQDHGRLIDADALCKTLRNLAENEYTPETFANWIEHHIDTIIPAEEGE